MNLCCWRKGGEEGRSRWRVQPEQALWLEKCQLSFHRVSDIWGDVMQKEKVRQPTTPGVGCWGALVSSPVATSDLPSTSLSRSVRIPLRGCLMCLGHQWSQCAQGRGSFQYVEGSVIKPGQSQANRHHRSPCLWPPWFAGPVPLSSRASTD